MSFNFLGGLARLLPGYIQGQRMANQDNWSDLMNYNKARAGQLSNLWTEATWQPHLDMTYDQSTQSALRTGNDWLTTNYNFGALPSMQNQIYANNIASYWSAPMQAMMPVYVAQNAMQAQRALPWGQQQQTPTQVLR